MTRLVATDLAKIPTNPLLWCSEAIADSFVRGFGGVQFIGMVEAASTDEASAEALHEFVAGMLHAFAKQVQPDDVPAPMAKALSRVMNICKAVVCILDPVPLAMSADITHVQQVLKYLGSDFMESEVRQIFRTQSWWQEKIKAAEKSASADHESAPLLQQSARDVCQATGAEEMFNALQKAYNLCLERSPLLRPGGTMELEGVMLDHIVALTDSVLAMGPEEQHTAKIDLEIIRKILNHAVGMEESDTEPGLKYADALRRLNAWKEENEATIHLVRLKQFHASVMQDSGAFSFGMFQKIVQLLSFDEASSEELKVQLIEPVAIMLLQMHKKVRQCHR